LHDGQGEVSNVLFFVDGGRRGTDAKRHEHVVAALGAVSEGVLDIHVRIHMPCIAYDSRIVKRCPGRLRWGDFRFPVGKGRGSFRPDPSDSKDYAVIVSGLPPARTGTT